MNAKQKIKKNKAYISLNEVSKLYAEVEKQCIIRKKRLIKVGLSPSNETVMFASTKSF